VDVGDDNYQTVTLQEILRGVIEAAPHVRNRPPRPGATALARSNADGARVDPSAKLTQAAYWRAMQGYLREGDVLFVDNGTSYALFGLKTRHYGAIVRRQDQQGPAKRPQSAERHDGIRGIYPGLVRRSRANHKQQQQGGRPQLRPSRPATPREPAAPAGRKLTESGHAAAFDVVTE
jgi:hypothetical protein